jgi:hypothetical protein
MLWLVLVAVVVALLVTGRVEAAAVAGLIGLVVLGRSLIVQSLRREEG